MDQSELLRYFTRIRSGLVLDSPLDQGHSAMPLDKELPLTPHADSQVVG